MARIEAETRWTASVPRCSPTAPCQPSLAYVSRVAFALRLWLFGLPVLPPVGGGEHLPALLPDLPRFRPWGQRHRLA